MKVNGIKRSFICLGVACSLFLASSCASEGQNPPPPNSHTVSFSVSAQGGGTIVGSQSQTVNEGERSSVVTALADVGYRFVGWSNGEMSDSIIINPTADVSLEAIFERETMSLPVMDLITDEGAEIVSKDVYLNCKVSVSNVEEEFILTQESGRVKGRGNTTWDMPKKPYKIKFDSKVNLFGNGAAKEWTLIANYSDQSLLRNYFAYSIGEQLGALADTTTKTQFVELYLNGRYDGVYLVCEQNEVGSTRVDIDDSLDSVDTGYLIELDSRAEEEDVYVTVEDIKYNIKSLDYEDIAEAGKNADDYKMFVHTYLSSCLSALNGNDWTAISNLVDVQSFAQSYLVNELFKTVDVAQTSFWMYKKPSGKLYSGPIWDYDTSSGNCNYVDLSPSALYATQNVWYHGLLKHEEFRVIVAELLNEKYQTIQNTLLSATVYAYENADSFERNFARWQTLGENVWPNPQVMIDIKTWTGQVQYLRAWLFQSLDYMKSLDWQNLVVS